MDEMNRYYNLFSEPLELKETLKSSNSLSSEHNPSSSLVNDLRPAAGRGGLDVECFQWHVIPPLSEGSSPLHPG